MTLGWRIRNCQRVIRVRPELPLSDMIMWELLKRMQEKGWACQEVTPRAIAMVEGTTHDIGGTMTWIVDTRRGVDRGYLMALLSAVGHRLPVPSNVSKDVYDVLFGGASKAATASFAELQAAGTLLVEADPEQEDNAKVLLESED